jgi:hypothetical protein
MNCYSIWEKINKIKLDVVSPLLEIKRDYQSKIFLFEKISIEIVGEFLLGEQHNNLK